MERIAAGAMLFSLLYLLLLGAGVYSFILFVQLANRGIKALDIYIRKNSEYL